MFSNGKCALLPLYTTLLDDIISYSWFIKISLSQLNQLNRNKYLRAIYQKYTLKDSDNNTFCTWSRNSEGHMAGVLDFETHAYFSKPSVIIVVFVRRYYNDDNITNKPDIKSLYKPDILL